MTELTVLARAVEAYIAAAEASAKPAKLPVLHGHATMLRALFVPQPTERSSGKGPPRLPFTITVEGYGNVHCYGLAAIGAILGMSPQTVANYMNKSKGLWRGSRYGPSGERDVTFTVVRELLGEHNEEAEAFLRRTQPVRQGRPLKHTAEARVGKDGSDAEYQKFMAEKVAGGMSRMKAIFEWRKHCGIDPE